MKNALDKRMTEIDISFTTTILYFLLLPLLDTPFFAANVSITGFPSTYCVYVVVKH